MAKYFVYLLCIGFMFDVTANSVVHAQTSRPSSRPTTRPTSSPSTRPTSSPSTRPTASPSTKPAVSSTTRPATRPKKRIERPKVRTPKAGTTFRIPKRTALLSFALPSNYEIWLDGLYVGKAPAAYLRIGLGLHETLLKVPGKPDQRFRFRVRPGYHTAIATRGRKLGVRLLRHEEVDVTVRSTKSPKAKESILPAGRYCVTPKKCLFLLPGEDLYVRSDGRILRRPSKRSLKYAQNYRQTPRSGFLSITSFPPGVLFLNKRPYAPTPLTRLPVAPGTYDILIKNTYMRAMWRGRVTIQAKKESKQLAFLHPFGGGSLQLQSRRPVRLFLDKKYIGWAPALTLPLPVGFHTLVLHYPNGQKITRKIRIKLHQRTSLYLP